MVVGSARLVRPERDTGRRHPAAAALGWRPFRDKFGVVGLEQQPASYYRAAAARARRLQAGATTPRVRQYLDKMIAHCEQLAGQVEPGISLARSATGRSRGRPRHLN